MFVSLSDCAGFPRIGDKIAVFGTNPRKPPPHNRRIGPGCSSKVSQCLPSPERTRWPGLRAPGKESVCVLVPIHAALSPTPAPRKLEAWPRSVPLVPLLDDVFHCVKVVVEGAPDMVDIAGARIVKVKRVAAR